MASRFMNKFQKIEDKADWQSLLNKALFKTFFHSLEWEEFLEKNFKWLKFEHYLYKDEVLLSLAKYKIFGKEQLISHPFCEYGGPLPLKSEIDGFSFKNALFQKFREPFKISFHPQIQKYFKNLGLKESDSQRDTYLIENLNLKTEKDIWNSLRKTTRNEIKKAKGNTLLIEKCQSGKDLKDFYRLYIKSARKHKALPYPFSFFDYFLKYNPNDTNEYSNATNKKVEIILAKFEKRVIAGSVFLFYDSFIHYFLNASDEKYKNLKVNYLILWIQIKNYLGKSYHTFDLGGTRRGSLLEIFKKGWGVQRYPIYEIKNYKEGKLRESKLRNILSFMPSFLIEKFGPHLLKYKL